MKKTISTLGFLFVFAFAVHAQLSNAILFTENGEKFHVILNGVLQNVNAETNVKLTQLNAPNYKCRIMFDDKSLGYVDFNLIFPEQGVENTWNIKKNKKGEYVTRGISSVPIAQAPPESPTQTVVVYSSTPPPAPAANTTVQHTRTTTTTTQPGDENVSINMGMNMNGEGGNISIHASGGDFEGNSTTTTTTTTTHSVTTTTNSPDPVMDPAPPPANPRVVYVNGYTGPIGCAMPMNPADFSSMKETIRSKSFEDTKFTIAKQVLQNNCLTAAQVKEVMQLFDFENTKLDYAKFAYAHTYDQGNYFKVNDAFEFENSVDDLNRSIGH